MQKYNYIFHPQTNKKYKINSKQGKNILKQYVKYIQKQSGGFKIPDINNLKKCGLPIDVSRYKTPCKSLPLDNFKKGGKKKKTSKNRKNRCKKSIKKK